MIYNITLVLTQYGNLYILKSCIGEDEVKSKPNLFLMEDFVLL